jgi:hypothetical protein
MENNIPTKWFTIKQISSWIGESLTTEGKKVEDLNGGEAKLIIMHQCGDNKEELKNQIRLFLYSIDDDFKGFAS